MLFWLEVLESLFLFLLRAKVGLQVVKMNWFVVVVMWWGGQQTPLPLLPLWTRKMFLDVVVGFLRWRVEAS